MARGRKKGQKYGKPAGKKELIDIIKVDDCEIKADSRQFILIHNGRQTYHSTILALINALFERKLKSKTVNELNDFRNAVIDAKKDLERKFSLSTMEESFRCNQSKEV